TYCGLERVPGSEKSRLIPRSGGLGFMDSSHSSVRSSVSHNSVSSDVVAESYVPSGTVLNAFTEEIHYAKKGLSGLCM
ncbi:hypothetical protein Tco_1398939, partial [Tanacetum coccineum]